MISRALSLLVLALALPWQRSIATAAANELLDSAWTADGGQAGAGLGSALATAGDVNGDGYSDVIIGAPGFDDVGLDEGAAQVYLGSAAGLLMAPAWSVLGTQAGARLGSSLATAGDVNGDGFSDVIVGAPGHDGGGGDEGRALVYLGSASGLATSPSWSVTGGQAGALFGSAVATAGDVNGDGFSDVIVGAPLHDGAHTDEGAAFVYAGSPTGLALTPSWTSLGGQAAARFGGAVSTAGDFDGDGHDDIVVGAAGFDGLSLDGGEVRLHLGSSGGLALMPAWTHSGEQQGEQLGSSVATAGDFDGDGYTEVLVAAPFWDASPWFQDTGNALLFRGSPGAPGGVDWSFSGFDIPGRFSPGCTIGSVSTAGDVNGDGRSDLVLGLEGFDFDEGTPDSGRVLVFLGPGLEPVEMIDGEQTGARLGAAVSTAGDADGDGYSDLLLGAPGHDDGEADEGRAFLYRGKNLPNPNSAWSVIGGQIGGRFGAALASGDFEGDGFADLLLGNPESTNDLAREGRALVYPGSPTDPPQVWSRLVEGDQSDCWFGAALACADVNGDGYDDAVVGAPLFDGTFSSEGCVFLYLGSPTGLVTTPVWSALGGLASARFGTKVARAGDVDGDGRDDVLVVAPGALRVYLYRGTPGGLSANAAWTAEHPDSDLGNSVASAGDVNGDGHDDVIVGAERYSGAGQANEGRARLYLGSPDGLSLSAAWVVEGDEAGARFGWSVASAGDVNGDGYDDVIVGAQGANRAHVYHGSATGLSPTSNWISIGQFSHGYIVSSAGDVDGDGYDDVLVAAPFEDFPLPPVVSLYLGAAGGLEDEVAWTTRNWLNVEFDHDALAPAGDLDGDGTRGFLLADSTLSSGRGQVFYFEHPDRLLGNFQQRAASGAATIERLGSTRPDGLFTIHGQLPRNLQGFSWASPEAPEARLEWELERLGVPFDGLETEQGFALEPLQPAGGMVAFDELAALDASPAKLHDVRGLPHHWRVRVTTNNPLFPVSPWLSLREFALRKPQRRP